MGMNFLRHLQLARFRDQFTATNKEIRTQRRRLLGYLVLLPTAGYLLTASSCISANGTLSSVALTFLGYIVSGLTAVANSFSTIVSTIATTLGITLPANWSTISAEITQWANFLSQLAQSIENAISSTIGDPTTLAGYVSKALTYITDIINAMSSLTSLIPAVGTAISYAAIVVQFLQLAVTYIENAFTGTEPDPTASITPAATILTIAKKHAPRLLIPATSYNNAVAGLAGLAASP